jgi:hypothetical protein
MLRIITQQELECRVKAVNRSLKWLARTAKVDPRTAYQGPKRYYITEALVAAQEAEEKRLLAHLARLHPQAAIEAATVALCPQSTPAAAVTA